MLVPASGKKPDFEPVVSALLNPIIQMCDQAAEAYKSKGLSQSYHRNNTGFDSGHKLGKRPSSSMEDILSNNVAAPSSQVESLRKIFLINCLSAIQQPLMGHEVAATFVRGLSVAMHINTLVDGKVSYIRNHLKKHSQSEIVS